MISEKLKELKNKFNLNEIDGYVVPKNDEYFSEFAKKDKLKTITGFDGSFGIAIILKKKNFLFVDGRYVEQAKIQAGKKFKILEIPKKLPYQILNPRLNLGFDPTVFTSRNLLYYFRNKGTKIIRLEDNYRSTQNILNVASHLISNNENRLGKKLNSNCP